MDIIFLTGNAEGNCYPQQTTPHKYRIYAKIFPACVLGLSFVIALALMARNKFWKNHQVPGELVRQPSLTEIDSQDAIDMIGQDSVYQFFLGTHWFGWIVALFTIASQIFMLSVFVGGAETELSDDSVDLVYTWKCPRDLPDCTDKADLTPIGWTSFALLMVAHLLKDAINGVKLIFLSAKERYSPQDRIRYFCGGTLLTFISLFTLFVSTIFNSAIATSDTEIIVNSVIILFVDDVDELFYDILNVINSRLVKVMSYERGVSEDSVNESVKVLKTQNLQLQVKVEHMETEMENIVQKMDVMQKYLGIEDFPNAH